MALRKEKIVEAAVVQRSTGAGEKEEILGIAFRYLEIPLCPSAIPTPLTFQLNLVPFGLGLFAYFYLTGLKMAILLNPLNLFMWISPVLKTKPI